ncbi:protein MIS12 homolog isoform X2 [Cherax quadricarinatus]|uniref:protein MIS12 homolog isoform X2 n=1 Tax=Cherax quadricarinatus TaxID=27406 RepID=UPI00387EB91A
MNNMRLSSMASLLPCSLKEFPEEILPSEGVNILRQHTDNTFTKTFQKFESHVLESVMKVPPHIILPTDIEQATPSSVSNINNIKADIEKLKVQLKNEKYMQAKFNEELQDISLVLKQQQKVLSDTLNGPRISNIEEAKEKLIFIKNAEPEIQITAEKVERVKELLKVDVQSSAEILQMEILKLK